MSQPRLRIAPTPSGLLHLGNGVNFVLTAAAARQLGGSLALRVDDLDARRTRPAYLADIGDTLRWLLPVVADDLLAGAGYQSQRRERYEEVLGDLRSADLVYGCRCTRRELAAARAAGSPSGQDVNDYPGTCRSRGLGLDASGTAWRTRDGDIVVRQRDGSPSYQLASLVDDVDAGITHLVRGADLADSTRMQAVLAQALAPLRPAFGAFAKTRCLHHGLVRDATGAKLSKSAGATSLRAMRARGVGAGAVLAEAGKLLGVADVPSLSALAAVAWDDLAWESPECARASRPSSPATRSRP